MISAQWRLRQATASLVRHCSLAEVRLLKLPSPTRPPMHLPPTRRRWALPLGLAVLLASLVPARAGEATGVPCPDPAVALLDGLYRWHVARQRDSGPLLLIDQRERFTPELYSQLVRALALKPSETGFVDFDVFSGTQVGTYGASVRSCRTHGNGLEALVAVQVGLRGRPDPMPMLLRYELRPGPGNSWRIADIVYPETPSLRLSTFLQSLLKQAARTER